MAQISRNDVYDKNLNFLIGSGASAGLLPTLSLELEDGYTGYKHTIETLATYFSEDPQVGSMIFSYYVKNVIKPAVEFDPYDQSKLSPKGVEALENYNRFIETIIALMRRKDSFKRANVFTTNYDGMIAHVAEQILQKRGQDFVLNDGGIGFQKRTLQTRAFSRYTKDQGVFDRHEISIPQINLIHLHGSVYWYKMNDSIEICYDRERAAARIAGVPIVKDQEYDEAFENPEFTEDDVEKIDFVESEENVEKFWEAYKELPIANPTKWKFHETVFEEHYYQALRLLSYELERPNSVFIVFGFSFADEHILNLVRRSLSNPSLQVFLCCFSDETKDDLDEKFEGYPNVKLLRVDGQLNFTAFNEEIFSANPET